MSIRVISYEMICSIDLMIIKSKSTCVLLDFQRFNEATQIWMWLSVIVNNSRSSAPFLKTVLHWLSIQPCGFVVGERECWIKISAKTFIFCLSSKQDVQCIYEPYDVCMGFYLTVITEIWENS